MRLAATTRTSEPCIGVMISDPSDRRQVLTALAPFARTDLCLSALDLSARIANGGLTGVVCECRDSYGMPLDPRALSTPAGFHVPTLILVRPIRADASFFTHIVQGGLPALARIPRSSDLGDVVRSVVERRWLPEATASIVRSITECVPAPVEMMLVLAMIAGSRRLGVSAFAGLIRMPERTLQRRLAVAGLPPAVRLLSWATSLHSAWRLEVHGERVKEVAAAGGFLTREAFTNFIRRHVNCTVSEMSQPGSFVQTLGTFGAELSRQPRLLEYAVLPASEGGVALNSPSSRVTVTR